MRTPRKGNTLNDMSWVYIYITTMFYRVDIGKNDEKFSLSFKANMSLIAKYVVDGRILILPIQGKGDATVDARK